MREITVHDYMVTRNMLMGNFPSRYLKTVVESAKTHLPHSFYQSPPPCSKIIFSLHLHISNTTQELSTHSFTALMQIHDNLPFLGVKPSTT
jgi:hypothetical protein